ncbi:prefoldin subunit 3, putative [Talaromyces stipitatus ATCC 10500]|uniref:Prefoldin subunit 3 n=1 Tax=Talaromyces stipitatus (strain ATCC 10500 / CBS 375.48 / QM 6759 / NRRL 1006) TaxID=441959 RepID=B8M6Y9_TALSN|nr:prefoldin subunit 3, putative [Talaromyces stipitatus ATCC 10500]EED20209.1 prefoldin subunit 3, putative [Talaromyces stipitatus ATCC 10500]
MTSAQKPGEGTNPRGIPYAPFVDNVNDYVSNRSEVESTLRSFQEMISKYQFMEMNTQRRSVGLKEKIPDIKKTLDMVRFLKLNQQNASDEDDEGAKEIETHFELNDTLYARAKISTKDTEEVYLWLGANVMLAYPIEEAETMLTEKLSAAELSLANCEEDLEFLREQITTLEVATARVYNWDVVQRRKEKAEGKDDEDKEEPDG